MYQSHSDLEYILLSLSTCFKFFKPHQGRSRCDYCFGQAQSRVPPSSPASHARPLVQFQPVSTIATPAASLPQFKHSPSAPNRNVRTCWWCAGHTTPQLASAATRPFFVVKGRTPSPRYRCHHNRRSTAQHPCARTRMPQFAIHSSVPLHARAPA
jgi:hypothetical protein